MLAATRMGLSIAPLCDAQRNSVREYSNERQMNE
jgi:hypothetical protein